MTRKKIQKKKMGLKDHINHLLDDELSSDDPYHAKAKHSVGAVLRW